MDIHPLRGRGPELARLRDGLDRLSAGHGSMAIVIGPPGSGKTRLLQEGTRLAGGLGVRVARVLGDPESRFVPGGSLLTGLLGGPTPVLRADRLSSVIDRPEQRYWLLEEIQASLERAALERPLLITVDDLQWCDDFTLLALRTLPERLKADQVMWLFAGRSGEDSPSYLDTRDRLLAGGAVALMIDQLDDEAAALMAGDLLGGPPPPELLGVISGTGNRPMLISELMLGLREEGALALDRQLRSSADLPARFRTSVQRRLLRLSPDAGSVLKVASVLSRQVAVPRLAALLHRPAASLLSPLQEALREGMLYEEDGELLFRPDLIQEAVRATVPEPLRRALRREAADLAASSGAPAVEVATLLADSAEPGDREAVGALRRAAAELAATSPSSAADLSGRALELAPPDLRRPVTAERVRLLWLAGRAREATDLGHGLLAVGNAGPRDEAAVRLGIAAAAGQHSFMEAVRQGEIASRLTGLDVGVRAPILALLGANLAMVGDFRRAARVSQDAQLTAVEAGDDAARATALASRSLSTLYLGRWSEAVDLADQAVAVSATVGTGSALWGSTQWRGWIDDLAGRPDLALEHAEAGLRAAQRDGQAWLLRQWTMDRSRLLYDAGRLEDARAEAEGVIAMSDELGAGNYADCTALFTLGRVALHTGDLVAARRYDREAARMRADEAHLVRRTGLWLRSLVTVAQGRDDSLARASLAEAAATLEEPGPSFSTPGDPADDVVFLRIALDLGERGWAERVAAVAARRSAANPDFGFLAAVAGHAEALLRDSADGADGADGADPDGLGAAVKQYREFRRPLPLALALEDLAVALGSGRDLDEAVARYEEAMALYEAAGASRDAARVRNALRGLGVRRRTARPVTGATPDRWTQLTATELDVVRKVAQGGTNREVAAEMFLSPHTVSTHLRHAFTKLDIRSRVELTRLYMRREDG